VRFFFWKYSNSLLIPLPTVLGSAWSEFKKFGTVHSIPMPAGYIDGQKIEKPIFTPSTKAEQGAHDENISPEQGN
jgi:phosphoribosylaminoimidazole-succinocarboxamide synthase